MLEPPRTVPDYSPRQTALTILLIMIWPFCVLWQFVVPVQESYWPITNDFMRLYYLYKVYLLDMLSHGHFPRWSPSEAGGFPFLENPFAQALYPLNAVLLALYNLLGGYTPLDHQRFTVFGISLFALGLFFWLRMFSLNSRALLFVCLTIPLSFKMTEILRFPNAVHSAAMYPWLLFFGTKMLLQPRLQWSAGFVCAIVGLVTAGYPYFLYYAPFLLIPYLALVALVSPLRLSLLGVAAISHGRAALHFSAALLLSGALTAPYLLRMRELLSQTVDRAGSSLNFSTQHFFTPLDSVASLVFPPAALIEGWFYIGMLPLLLILWHIVTTARHATAKDRWSCVLVVTLLSLISILSYAESTPIFHLLWSYLPGFSALRTWARINILLLPVFALALVLAYEHFEHVLVSHAKPPLSLLITLLAATLLLQMYFVTQPGLTSSYWDEYATHLTPLLLSSLCFGIVVGSALLLAHFRIWYRIPRWLLPLCVVVTVVDTSMVGPWVWAGTSRIPTPARRTYNLPEQLKLSFSAPRTAKAAISLSSTFGTGIIPNWYFSRYVDTITALGTDRGSLDELLGHHSGQRFFFATSLTVELHDLLQESRTIGWQVELQDYTGEYLNSVVTTPQAGFLIFVDNWSSRWTARVDGRDTQLHRAYGTFKAVALPPGRSVVELVYE